jgi:hypothetical protein
MLERERSNEESRVVVCAPTIGFMQEHRIADKNVNAKFAGETLLREFPSDGTSYYVPLIRITIVQFLGPPIQVELVSGQPVKLIGKQHRRRKDMHESKFMLLESDAFDHSCLDAREKMSERSCAVISPLTRKAPLYASRDSTRDVSVAHGIHSVVRALSTTVRNTRQNRPEGGSA